MGTVHANLGTVHANLGTSLGSCGSGGGASGGSGGTTLHDLGTVHADLSTVHTDLGTVHLDLGTVHLDLGIISISFVCSCSYNGILGLGLTLSLALGFTLGLTFDLGSDRVALQSCFLSSLVQLFASERFCEKFGLNGVLVFLIPHNISPFVNVNSVSCDSARCNKMRNSILSLRELVNGDGVGDGGDSAECESDSHFSF